MPLTFIGELKSNMTLENWERSLNDTSILPRLDSKDQVSIRRTQRGEAAEMITILEANPFVD